MINDKPTLLAYLNGLPDFESIYPILVTLDNRAKINIKVIVYSKLLRKEPRLAEAFQKYNISPIMGSKFSMKFAFWKDINKADAVLTIADPNFDTTTRKQRSYYIKKIQKTPSLVMHLRVLKDSQKTYFYKKFCFFLVLVKNPLFLKFRPKVYLQLQL